MKEILAGDWLIGDGRAYKGIKDVVQKAELGEQWLHREYLVKSATTHLKRNLGEEQISRDRWRVQL